MAKIFSSKWHVQLKFSINETLKFNILTRFTKLYKAQQSTHLEKDELFDSAFDDKLKGKVIT